MKKPTVADIKTYCQERGNKIDAEYFYDYHEARGWMLKGNVRMKNWQATIRTWEKVAGFTKGPTAKQETVQEQIRRFQKRHSEDLEPMDGKWLKAVKDRAFGIQEGEEEFK